MRFFKKKYLIICVLAGALLCFTSLDAGAANVSLEWNKNPESDIAGYRVYYGTTSRTYTTVVNVGNYTSCLISGLRTNRTYYFACTAYNTSGLESNYSAETSYRPRRR